MSIPPYHEQYIVFKLLFARLCDIPMFSRDPCLHRHEVFLFSFKMFRVHFADPCLDNGLLTPNKLLHVSRTHEFKRNFFEMTFIIPHHLPPYFVFKDFKLGRGEHTLYACVQGAVRIRMLDPLLDPLSARSFGKNTDHFCLIFSPLY